MCLKTLNCPNHTPSNKRTTDLKKTEAAGMLAVLVPPFCDSRLSRQAGTPVGPSVTSYTSAVSPASLLGDAVNDVLYLMNCLRNAMVQLVLNRTKLSILLDQNP
jgi:hypothetical protein